MPPLRQNDRAPEFRARTTRGDVALSDYRGRWLLLFSHPADFTPVCTSEFIAFARAKPRFDALGCELLALSVDGLYSHLAWIRDIHERFGVAIDFPIIEDPTLAIARAYGMVGPDAEDASSVRATLFIDPDGVLRASTCYPATIGRSIDEMLRTVAALQRVQRGDVLAPVDWLPGHDLLAVPSQALPDVLAGEGSADWFYCAIKDSPQS